VLPDEPSQYEDYPIRSWSLELKGYKNDEITKLIEKVEFKLHESFENPVRGKVFIG
jgi:transcription initiation factor IIF auxiliary subunit